MFCWQVQQRLWHRMDGGLRVASRGGRALVAQAAANSMLLLLLPCASAA